MRKFPAFFLLSATLFLFACGNDPAVEASYVDAIEKCVRQLDASSDTEALVKAQDMLDSAKSLPGVLDLGKSKAVKEVEERLNVALEKAQDRVMEALRGELADTVGL